MLDREHGELTKHTLLLYEGDFDRLRDLFPDQGGSSVIIRNIVRQVIEKTERKSTQSIDVSQIIVE